MDADSENIDLIEFEKSESDTEKNITIPNRYFYLIKWDTLEYSLELDSFMETFPNFNQMVSAFNLIENESKKAENYPNETTFSERVGQILFKLGVEKGDEFENLINNSFIYRKKEELFLYKKKIVSIITKLLTNFENKYLPHILILNDTIGSNETNTVSKLLENNDINYLELFNNKQAFIYECINLGEDLISPLNKNELNILRINNNIYLNKNKETLLEEDMTKRYLNQNIVVDNIDSINVSFMQDYYFDLIIFDLKNDKSLIKLKEFFRKITSPLNVNYKNLKYILLEQSESLKEENQGINIENNNININNNNSPINSDTDSLLNKSTSTNLSSNNNINNEMKIEGDKNSNNNNTNKLFDNFQKNYMNFFNLFYNKEDTVLLYGNYSGTNKNILSLNNTLAANKINNTIQQGNNMPNTINVINPPDENENLRQINLIPCMPFIESDQDMDAFHLGKNFINKQHEMGVIFRQIKIPL